MKPHIQLPPYTALKWFVRVFIYGLQVISCVGTKPYQQVPTHWQKLLVVKNPFQEANDSK